MKRQGGIVEWLGASVTTAPRTLSVTERPLEPAVSVAPRSPTRLQIAVWAVVLLTMLVLSLTDYHSFQVGAYGDDATYVLLASSLAYGGSYGLPNTPPTEPTTAPFPFGYPLLLVPFALLFPGNLDAMKALSLIATCLNAALLFWGWRWFSRRSHWWSLAVVSATVFSHLVISQSRMVMSEPIFTTLCLGALLLTEQITRGCVRWWRIALLSVVLLLTFGVRTVGIATIMAVFVYLIWRRRLRAIPDIALIITLMVATVGVIVATTPIKAAHIFPTRYLKGEDAALVSFVRSIVPLGREQPEMAQGAQEGETHVGEAPLDMRRFLEYTLYWGALYHLAHDARRLVIPVGSPDSDAALALHLGFPHLALALGLAFSLVFLLGLVRWIVSGEPKIGLVFLAVYFSSICLWPWQDPRFLYPIQAQLVFTFLLGTEMVAVWGGKLTRSNTFQPWQRVVPAVVTLILVALSIRASLGIENSRNRVGDLQARTQWVRANTLPLDIVMTELPVVDYLYGGRKTVALPQGVQSADGLYLLLTEHSIDYILAGPQLKWRAGYPPIYSSETRRIRALIEVLLARGRLERVYHSEDQLIEMFSVRD